MKRYDIETSIGEDWEAVERKDGEYVTYDDHLATIATLTDRLTATEQKYAALVEAVCSIKQVEDHFGLGKAGAEVQEAIALAAQLKETTYES